MFMCSVFNDSLGAQIYILNECQFEYILIVRRIVIYVKWLVREVLESNLKVFSEMKCNLGLFKVFYGIFVSERNVS